MQPDSPELTLKLIDALVQGGFVKGAAVLVDGRFVTVDLTMVATTKREQVLSDIRAVCPEFAPECQAALTAALECVRGAEYWSLNFDFVTEAVANLVTLDADRFMKREG
ncbi:MAG: hypothetical protein RL324_477 [Verrucomicrobiota bacterium]|jgi:hypothetical protein